MGVQHPLVEIGCLKLSRDAKLPILQLYEIAERSLRCLIACSDAYYFLEGGASAERSSPSRTVTHLRLVRQFHIAYENFNLNSLDNKITHTSYVFSGNHFYIQQRTLIELYIPHYPQPSPHNASLSSRNQQSSIFHSISTSKCSRLLLSRHVNFVNALRHRQLTRETWTRNPYWRTRDSMTRITSNTNQTFSMQLLRRAVSRRGRQMLSLTHQMRPTSPPSQSLVNGQKRHATIVALRNAKHDPT